MTPSRLPRPAQDRPSARSTALGAAALGLRDGPIHAELRWNADGAVDRRDRRALDRRALRPHAPLRRGDVSRGADPPSCARTRDPSPEPGVAAAGVMMIPIPKAGVLEEVHGLEAARAVPEIADVTITAHPGQRLVPLPEGSRYLGFLFRGRGSGQRRSRASRGAREAGVQDRGELSGSGLSGGRSATASGSPSSTRDARHSRVISPARSTDCGRRRGRWYRGFRRPSGRGCGSPFRCPASASRRPRRSPGTRRRGGETRCSS